MKKSKREKRKIIDTKIKPFEIVNKKGYKIKEKNTFKEKKK